jgi:hypothetical protein
MLLERLVFPALAGALALGAIATTTLSSPASAATLITHCDRYGVDCYRVRCDNEGENCARLYDYDDDRRVRRSSYRHWYCDGDGCRWTYDYILHRYRDNAGN